MAVRTRIRPEAAVPPGVVPARALLGRLALLCAAVRVVLEAVGLLALRRHDQPVLADALDMWNRWDGHHFLRLAEVGYVTSSPAPNADDPLYVVFYPGYPAAVHGAAWILQDVVLSALVVSYVCSVAAGYFLFRLVALDFAEAAAWRAVLLLYAFPTAYFLAAPFSESLFLAAVLASVYGARTGRWAKAGLAGAVASGTRITGVALGPALLAQALVGRSSLRERARNVAWAALSAVGLLTYLGINQVVHGSPFHFLDVQRSHWRIEAAPPWTPLRDSWRAVTAGGLDSTTGFIHWWRLPTILAAAALLVVVTRVGRPADWMFGWASLLLVLSTSWLISFPRYMLAIYPIFLAGAYLTRSARVFWPVIGVSAALQCWLMGRYAAGAWTF